MFKRLKLRFKDMKTISRLISGADEQARQLEEAEPGAEHFVLSALNLPDGSAQRIFDQIGIEPGGFAAAIKKQYTDALNAVGISDELIATDPEPLQSTQRFQNSKPSGQAVMKLLYKLKQNDKDRPILGAHVISVVAGMEHGVAARAFKTLAVEPDTITKAVQIELKSAVY